MLLLHLYQSLAPTERYEYSTILATQTRYEQAKHHQLLHSSSEQLQVTAWQSRKRAKQRASSNLSERHNSEISACLHDTISGAAIK
mmetsp:Transcript_45472/g.55193  ORF Transcript_45472/g.55193 Transcript_45472/m.55193 type:complete len:86 (-) Transcript_45472:183-440(-)